jgi:hypothetical protein
VLLLLLVVVVVVAAAVVVVVVVVVVVAVVVVSALAKGRSRGELPGGKTGMDGLRGRAEPSAESPSR